MARILAQQGNLVVVDFGRAVTALHSKKQEAARLGRSTRWLELRVREGCPSVMQRGRRMFRPQEVDDWLASQGKRAADG